MTGQKRLEKGRFNAPWEGPRDRPWCLTPGELALFLVDGDPETVEINYFSGTGLSARGR